MIRSVSYEELIKNALILCEDSQATKVKTGCNHPASTGYVRVSTTRGKPVFVTAVRSSESLPDARSIGDESDISSLENIPRNDFRSFKKLSATI